MLVRNVGNYHRALHHIAGDMNLQSMYHCPSAFTSYVLRVILLSNSETMNPLDKTGLAGHHTVPKQHNSPGFYMQNAIKETRKRIAMKLPCSPSQSA